MSTLTTAVILSAIAVAIAIFVFIFRMIRQEEITKIYAYLEHLNNQYISIPLSFKIEKSFSPAASALS